MRTALIIAGLLVVPTFAPGCCLLGPPQKWSFATVCPRNADLVGRYNAEIHGPPGSSLGARPEWIVLDADMTFKAGVATTARGASDQQTLHGTWAVAPLERTSHYKLVLTDADGATPLELIVWHNTPAHKLWIVLDDPDSGNGVLYRMSAQQDQPKR